MLSDLAAFCGEHPSVIQALVGPRQVGKTTLARQLMAKVEFPSIYASADAPLPPGPEWIETQWRQAEIKSAAEVDFVVEQRTALWALEVKSGRGQKASGLNRFRQHYPQSRMLIVGAEGIPLSTFFETPPGVLLGA